MRFLPILFTLIFFACEGIYEKGNGNMSTEERSLDRFSEIEIKGKFQVELQRGRKEGVRIITDENLHQYIETRVSRDRLEIETSQNISSKEAIRLIIIYDDLELLRLSGACALSSEDLVDVRSLRIDVEGAGVVELEVDTRTLELDLSGAGLVELEGRVRKMYVDLGGAGSLNAYDLVAEEAEIDLSGIGTAQVNVRDRLSGVVTGVGSIKYKGNPETVNTNVTGLGKIEPAAEHEKGDVDIDI
jgi:hypothetical protein